MTSKGSQHWTLRRRLAVILGVLVLGCGFAITARSGEGGKGSFEHRGKTYKLKVDCCQNCQLGCGARCLAKCQRPAGPDMKCVKVCMQYCFGECDCCPEGFGEGGFGKGGFAK